MGVDCYLFLRFDFVTLIHHISLGGMLFLCSRLISTSCSKNNWDLGSGNHYLTKSFISFAYLHLRNSTDIYLTRFQLQSVLLDSFPVAKRYTVIIS